MRASLLSLLLLLRSVTGSKQAPAPEARQGSSLAAAAASHSDEVAEDAIAAVLYTRDALLAANADGKTTEELQQLAQGLEDDAGHEVQKKTAIDEAGKSSKEHHDENDAAQSKDSSAGAVEKDLDGAEQKVESMESAKAANEPNGEDLEALRERLGELRGKLEHATGASSGRLDINTEPVPYPNAGQPFGGQETAAALTNSSVEESEGMIKQIEQAETMEGKRAVNRALTRLRGLTIAAYDGIAKASMHNVDTYSKTHKWRDDHKIRHLAEEEADPQYWAFPANGAPSPAGSPAASPVSAPASMADPPAEEVNLLAKRSRHKE